MTERCGRLNAAAIQLKREMLKQSQTAERLQATNKNLLSKSTKMKQRLEPQQDQLVNDFEELRLQAIEIEQLKLGWPLGWLRYQS